MFDYSGLIGDEGLKRGEAVMKYTGEDTAKTTKIRDVLDAVEILSTPSLETVENCPPPPFENHDEQGHYMFFCDVGLAVYRDYYELFQESTQVNVKMNQT